MNTINKLSLAMGLALSCAVPALHAEEKTLRLYNWADYFAEDTLSKFTAETGIKVIYDVMEGSETLEAKMLAGGSGYDLIFPGDTVAERLMRAGSLQPLDQSKIAAMADIEPGLQKLRSRYEYSSKATVPYTGAPSVLPTTPSRSPSVRRTRRSIAWTCCSNRSWRRNSPTAASR